MAVVAICGAGPGMGMALARRFAKEGFGVALIGRPNTDMSSFVSELEGMGVQATQWGCDLTDATQLRTTLESIAVDMHGLDVMVYNASYGVNGLPTAVTVDDFQQALDVSFKGAVVACQVAAEKMRTQGWGTILVTGSAVGVEPYAAMATLSVGKSAVRSFAISLFEDLQNDNVHAAIVTIHGALKAGSRFDPELIADTFWNAHAERKSEWLAEYDYK